jgi:hypothetical protein
MYGGGGKNPKRDLRIVLRVYNHAHVPSIILFEGERETAAVFQQAGVAIKWTNCAPSSAGSDSFSTCKQPQTQSGFSLDLLGQAITTRVGPHRDTLGFAQPCTSALPVCNAYVFYDRVAEWARHGEISAHRLLGYTIAHELGHLLLGAGSHSPTGIMSGRWTPKDFTMMARDSLYLTPDQLQHIQAGVQKRMAPREGSREPEQVPAFSDREPPIRGDGREITVFK